jgi:cobB protein
MKKIVVLTGAGISQESGIKTFRDAGGLWEGYPVLEVATPEGYARNPELVLAFYNARRRELKKAQPNAAHYALKQLEKSYEVSIITQNIDDLHERAGSKNIIHLHGELNKVRSLTNEQEILDWQGDLSSADTDSQGGPLRPHVVWFGEAVPNIVVAMRLVKQADVLLVIGTSLQVYPAAGLIDTVKSSDIPIYLVDPKPDTQREDVTVIQAKAGEAVPRLVKKLLHQVE